MEKRRRQILIGFVLSGLGLALGCCVGCGSMAVDKLLSCTRRGIVVAEKNDELLLARLEQQIRGDIEHINNAFDRDVDIVDAGSLKTVDGVPVSLDARWVKEAREGYFLLLDNKYRQLTDLEQTRIKLKSNTQTIKRLVEQARELNKVYLTNAQGIQMLLDELGNQAMENLETANEDIRSKNKEVSNE